MPPVRYQTLTFSDCKKRVRIPMLQQKIVKKSPADFLIYNKTTQVLTF